MYLIFEGQQFDHASQQGHQMAALGSRTGRNGAVEFRQENTVLVTHVCSPESMKQPYNIVSFAGNRNCACRCVSVYHLDVLCKMGKTLVRISGNFLGFMR